jgi:NADP-dependent 3-hydroxy acid dehydrogenase YdfG
MTGRFQNKVVVVTGGTSGIGLATAQAFSREGASVFVTGRRQDALDAAVKEIDGRVTGVRGDMANLADIDRSTTRSSRSMRKSTWSSPTPAGASSRRSVPSPRSTSIRPSTPT